MSESLPLLAREDDAPFARVDGRLITQKAFLGDVLATAEGLPDCRHVVNVCASRYTFTVSFFAAIVAGSTNLLPSQRREADIRDLASSHEDTCVIGDEGEFELAHRVRLQPGSHGDGSNPSLDPEHIAAVAFTSGSTGTPQPHPKSWQLLHAWRQIHAHHLPPTPSGSELVATVPSWHMYGLEWAMLLPTIAPLVLHCGADFFPSDVTRALGNGPQRVLVSTPVHLAALSTALAASRDEVQVATVLSATAPLDLDLCNRIEHRVDGRLLEIYGCSEIGSLAWRFPSEEPHWHFFDAFDVACRDETLSVAHPLLPEAVTLADRFQQHADGWQLLGRASDIVKVAGKRESLANLNLKLLAVNGVTDGFFYQPEDLGLPGTGRLGAVVVAPDRQAADIKAALARSIDAAFLPRPLHRVEQLPREASSKLPKTAMRDLLLNLSSKNHD